MKVVFLDVDGILTYSDYENEDTSNIDVDKVKLLKEICDSTNAKVVISSSWRGSETYTPRFYHILISILMAHDIEVLGDAPYIEVEYENNVSQLIAEITLEDLPYLKIKYGTGRAAEIQKWISEHDVDSFVILDDEDWNWADYGYDKYWIQPTWFGDGGLKREYVDRAIAILNGEVIYE